MADGAQLQEERRAELKEARRALAERLRALRLSRGLNRKQLGLHLAKAMNRSQGPYGHRRIGDFENWQAKSPPPRAALRGYAVLFGRDALPPNDGDPSPKEVEHIQALDGELLRLREHIEVLDRELSELDGRTPIADLPKPRWKKALAVCAVIAVVGIAAAVLGPEPDRAPEEMFCSRNLKNQPPVSAVAVICAQDVRLRPAPGGPALEVLMSGDGFEIDNYTPGGEWVLGTARLRDGREVQGWIQAGWFCPADGTESHATACAEPRR